MVKNGWFKALEQDDQGERQGCGGRVVSSSFHKSEWKLTGALIAPCW